MRNLSGTYYLNNHGSRWVIYENGKKVKLTFNTTSGAKVERTVIYFESFGNFAIVCISWKGKKIKVFADTVLDN